MIKFGVFSDAQLANGKQALTPFTKTEKTISITLYDRIVDLPNAEELSARILKLFSDERGAWKRTYANRFPEFDRFVVDFLAAAYPDRQDLQVLDLGVSDARTSCDFFRQLAPHFPAMTFEALDYDASITIIEAANATVTLSRENRILEVVCPPFVFNTMKRDSVRYPLNLVLRALAVRYRAMPVLRRYLAGKIKGRTIWLFAPAAMSLARTDARFRLGQHDLMNRFQASTPADVLRVMNVFNPLYFTPSERRRVISNIHCAVSDGGWLVTGSNQDPGSLVHGGIFRRTALGFEQVWQSGDGSHFAAEILSHQAVADFGRSP